MRLGTRRSNADGGPSLHHGKGWNGKVGTLPAPPAARLVLPAFAPASPPALALSVCW